MTNPLAPSAILTLLIIVMFLVSALKRKDPILLACRWAYAFRRAVWICGAMLLDTPGEFKLRWVEQRPNDAAELQALADEFPAGESE